MSNQAHRLPVLNETHAVAKTTSSRFPFSSYPRGWYQLEQSKNLRRGKILNLHYFGKELVLYRGQDGAARLFDAHCPHLGAHLGVGGRIDGNDLVCPFHAWKFDAEGQCKEIPYCDRIPKRARLLGYPVKESNGVVFAYYSEDRRAPEFELPSFDEFRDPAWSAPKTLVYEVRSHVQEMAENALDIGHFPGVHQMTAVPTVAHFSVGDSELSIRLKGVRKIFGITSEMDFELRAVGLGIVFGTTETSLMSVRAIHAATPIDEQTIRVAITYVFKKDWNPLRTLVFRTFMNREIRHFTQGDQAILEHKQYVERPLLCATDGPIGRLRQWSKRFYAETTEPSHV